MKFFRRLFVLIIVLVIIAAALYINRVAVLDWISESSKPDLPPAVAFEDVAREPLLEEVFADVEPEYVEEEEVVVVEEEVEKEEIIDVVEEIALEDVEDVVDEKEIVEEVETELPLAINLAVPFTSQAPSGNWDQPYQDLCEEASVYMVERYFAGEPEGQISNETADEDLLKIRDFEVELFGYYESTTAEQTGIFAELMFGFSSSELIENPTVEQIKQHVAAGRPVIVPAAGRLLGNPNFTAPGPLYHMLVIRGYTEDGRFITNDPGTRNGEQYLYDFDTIMYAMHDWNEGEVIDGRKVIIIIYP
jgi:hypothetical protein